MNAPSTPIPGLALTADGASPVMAQYFEAKARQPDALIFFRMGDFYELFFDDAARAAEAIGIALTHRGAHQGRPIPMAGVPVHASEAYLAKLIRAGFKVAVCEQMEDPAEARKRGSKSIVRRELVRVVTPGTLTEEGLLDARGANRLSALGVRGGEIAVASVDISTGEVECLTTRPNDLASVLTALASAEILVPDRLFGDAIIAQALNSLPGRVQPMAAALAEPAASEARLKRLYGVATLDGFGRLSGAEIAALGLIGAHLDATQGGRLPPLRAPSRAADGVFMMINPATRASLEIDRALSGAREGSLLAAVDRTVSAPGSRLLAARLARPLLDPQAIEARLDGVEWFVEHPSARRATRETLKGVGDLARSLSRLALARGGPRDLACLRDGVQAARTLAEHLKHERGPLGAWPLEIEEAASTLAHEPSSAVSAFADRLCAGLAGEIAANAKEGGFVTPGFRAELDEARGLRDDSRRVVAALETRLAEQSGVALRVRHNAVLGYFIEATAKQAETLSRPPLRDQFIHRQTLANQMRFTTLELSELDARIARASDRALALELEIFEAWRAEAHALSAGIHALVEGLARLDVAAALAEWASECDAARPLIDTSLVFEARGARHPVVEAAVRKAGEPYTPNDCILDGAGEAGPRLAIVTGPNMAGKSTFLRQNALLAILAQAGSFVPAHSLRLGLVDRLFSRVGAGDDLAKGRSTFMAEMVETAEILTQATDRSLVILDEIGRGTATYDGLAIAWACAEALHDANRSRVLFATHYHELAVLEQRLTHVANLSMVTKEFNGGLVFLHEAAPGCADRSYGLQVAQLAGVPGAVVSRARRVLHRLENQAPARTDLRDLPLFAVSEAEPERPEVHPVAVALAELDLDGMSPREAMEALYRLKGLLTVNAASAPFRGSVPSR
jgi:DNA mismatch repair protein MutS